MTDEELLEYAGKKPIATCHLSNHGGVAILDVIHGINDGVVYQYYDEAPAYAEIEYEVTGEQEDESEEMRAYFKVGEMKIYLDECIRV